MSFRFAKIFDKLAIKEHVAKTCVDLNVVIYICARGLMTPFLASNLE